MKKTIITKFLISTVTIMTVALPLFGCGNTDKTQEVTTVETVETAISDETMAAIEDLYAVQLNYSKGTATLNIIPFTTVEEIYNNWDSIIEANLEKAPISLREYVDPSIVYLDYSTDYSIKWDKETGDVLVEQTDVAAREDYKQKAHK